VLGGLIKQEGIKNNCVRTLTKFQCKNVSKWNWTQGTLGLDVFMIKTLMNNQKITLGQTCVWVVPLGTTS